MPREVRVLPSWRRKPLLTLAPGPSHRDPAWREEKRGRGACQRPRYHPTGRRPSTTNTGKHNLRGHVFTGKRQEWRKNDAEAYEVCEVGSCRGGARGTCGAQTVAGSLSWSARVRLVTGSPRSTRKSLVVIWRNVRGAMGTCRTGPYRRPRPCGPHRHRQHRTVQTATPVCTATVATTRLTRHLAQRDQGRPGGVRHTTIARGETPFPRYARPDDRLWGWW